MKYEGRIVHTEDILRHHWLNNRSANSKMSNGWTQFSRRHVGMKWQVNMVWRIKCMKVRFHQCGRASMVSQHAQELHIDLIWSEWDRALIIIICVSLLPAKKSAVQRIYCAHWLTLTLTWLPLLSVTTLRFLLRCLLWKGHIWTMGTLSVCDLVFKA